MGELQINVSKQYAARPFSGNFMRTQSQNKLGKVLLGTGGVSAFLALLCCGFAWILGGALYNIRTKLSLKGQHFNIFLYYWNNYHLYWLENAKKIKS